MGLGAGAGWGKTPTIGEVLADCSNDGDPGAIDLIVEDISPIF